MTTVTLKLLYFKGFNFFFVIFSLKNSFNPLPHMAILGLSNSPANKDMMSKIWTDGATVI